MPKYVKTVWVNDSSPARNAINLNKQEQGIYDAVVIDENNTFEEAQRTTIDFTGNNVIDFDVQNNFSFTATVSNVTVATQTVGQGGMLIIASAENITGWASEFDFGSHGVPTGLTGVETFGYFISHASGADSIRIGRV